MSDKSPTVRVPRDIILQTANAIYKVAQNKPELLNYGINETYLTTFLADIAKADSFMNDTALKNEKKGVTKVKNVKLDLCYAWLKAAKYHYTNKYEKTDPQFLEFPGKISDYANNESKMIDLLPNVFKLLTKYKTDLTSMPEDFISNGELLQQDLKTQNTTQEAKKTEDKNYTATRRAAEIVVYNKVNKITDAGRLAYATKPEMLKLFESPWPKPKAGKDDAETPPTDPTPPPAG